MPLAFCSIPVVFIATLASPEEGCASTFTAVCASADGGRSTWVTADFSALLSSPAAIDWTRKKPRTAMTSTDSTRVVETTRNCSERCQRLFSCATMRRCHRRPTRSQRLTGPAAAG